MTMWEVVYTAQAEKELRDVYEYIAFSLLEPKIAKHPAHRIIDAIASLNQMPMRCQKIEREPWGKRGMRVMPIGHYLVFYLPITAKKRVAIISIMYGGRDIEAQLSEADADDNC